MRFNVDTEGWFTKEVLEALSEKNRLYKKARNNGSEENWTKFKNQRNYARALLLNTKQEFLKGQIEVNRGNPKAFWRKLNSIIGNSKNSHSFSSIHNDLGEKLERTEAAEFINNYFTNIGESLHK